MCFPAAELDAPTPRRVPAWLARLLIDEHLVDLLVCSMPTTSARFRDVFDWTPTYPTIDEGLTQVVTRWREWGLVRETGDGYDWTGIGEGSNDSDGGRVPRRWIP